MFMPFDYFIPKTLKEALSLLHKNNKAEILAGGTDLFVDLRKEKKRPQVLIDIKNIKELKEVNKKEGYISIGSLTTMNEIASHSVIKKRYRMLHQAAGVMGCYEIRNRATIGGNIVTASPGAEMGCPLRVLDAEILLKSVKGERSLTTPLLPLFPVQADISQFWSEGSVWRDRGA